VLAGGTIASVTLEDIALPHFGLHELKGDRAGTWAIKVNKNWRVTFAFADGDVMIQERRAMTVDMAIR
jgi:plasmid maintenance system killer protein